MKTENGRRGGAGEANMKWNINETITLNGLYTTTTTTMITNERQGTTPRIDCEIAKVI